MIRIQRLATTQPDFEARLAELLAFESVQDPKVDADVAAILADVKARGDAAVLEYTRRFDRALADSVAALEVPRAELGAGAEAHPESEPSRARNRGAARARLPQEADSRPRGAIATRPARCWVSA